MDKYLLKRPPSALVTIPSKKSKPSARQGTVPLSSELMNTVKINFTTMEEFCFARIVTW